jgi:cysteine synthase A
MVHHIVDRAIVCQEITDKTILIEATSGNTGIALASAGAALGLPVKIIMPCNMSVERKQMMCFLGADILEVASDDFESAICLRDELLSTDENFWSPKQFSNPANIECHFLTTGPEIQRQLSVTGLEWDAFIHCSGTGGTMMGVRQHIDVLGGKTQTILVVPAEPAGEHGIQGINDGADFLLRREAMNSIIEVTTQQAIDRAKALAKTHGLLVGISSGANVYAAEKWIEQNKPQGAVVTMLCDRGERYTSIFRGTGL